LWRSGELYTKYNAESTEDWGCSVDSGLRGMADYDGRPLGVESWHALHYFKPKSWECLG